MALSDFQHFSNLTSIQCLEKCESFLDLCQAVVYSPIDQECLLKKVIVPENIKPRENRDLYKRLNCVIES